MELNVDKKWKSNIREDCQMCEGQTYLFHTIENLSVGSGAGPRAMGTERGRWS